MFPKLVVRIFHYLWVGGIAGLISFGLYFPLTEFFGVHYVVSGIIAYVIAHTVNFFLNKKTAFKESEAHKHKSYILFMFFGAISITIITYLTFVFTESFGLHYFTSRIIAAPVGGIMNFVLNYMYSFEMKKHFREDIKLPPRKKKKHKKRKNK